VNAADSRGGDAHVREFPRILRAGPAPAISQGLDGLDLSDFSDCSDLPGL